MGLDMYLAKSKYIPEYDDKFAPVREHLRKLPLEGVTGKVDTITIEVGYWRKANAIHKWFVDNCGGGTDDCKPIYVEKDDLRTLLNRCRKVRASLMASRKVTKEVNGYEFEVFENTELAMELLPPLPGFCFGSQMVDEDYMDDLNYTITILEREFEYDKNYLGWDYEYRASW